MLPTRTAVLYLATGLAGSGRVRCSSWMRVSGLEGMDFSFFWCGLLEDFFVIHVSGPRSSRQPEKSPHSKKSGRGCPRPLASCVVFSMLLAGLQLLQCLRVDPFDLARQLVQGGLLPVEGCLLTLEDLL